MEIARYGRRALLGVLTAVAVAWIGSATAQTPYTPGNQPGNYQFTNPTQTTVGALHHLAVLHPLGLQHVSFPPTRTELGSPTDPPLRDYPRSL